jgi:hypothetical protein
VEEVHGSSATSVSCGSAKSSTVACWTDDHDVSWTSSGFSPWQVLVRKVNWVAFLETSPNYDANCNLALRNFVFDEPVFEVTRDVQPGARLRAYVGESERIMPAPDPSDVEKIFLQIFEGKVTSLL